MSGHYRYTCWPAQSGGGLSVYHPSWVWGRLSVLRVSWSDQVSATPSVSGLGVRRPSCVVEGVFCVRLQFVSPPSPTSSICVAAINGCSWWAPGERSGRSVWTVAVVDVTNVVIVGLPSWCNQGTIGGPGTCSRTALHIVCARNINRLTIRTVHNTAMKTTEPAQWHSHGFILFIVSLIMIFRVGG